MNFEPTIASAVAGAVYSVVGYARQQKEFSWKRSSLTIGISVAIGTVMAVSGHAPADPITAGAVSIAFGSILKKGVQWAYKKWW